jgi:hypothetical protein
MINTEAKPRSPYFTHAVTPAGAAAAKEAEARKAARAAEAAALPVERKVAIELAKELYK